MNILLLSAYDAQSHRYWRRSLQSIFRHDNWTCLALPPRFFHWRIRGNSLTWSESQAESLSAPYDLCIATSMVDFATLRGLVPSLTGISSVLYFHENQFAFPSSAGLKKRSSNNARLEPLMVQLYSALCADALCFNSRYNLESFISGVDSLLSQMPDAVPPGISRKLYDKSQVLPVPLLFSEFDALNVRKTKREKHYQLVWNHRWEYDKGPERLLAFVKRLPDTMTLRFHILGQSFRRAPACFSEIHDVLSRKGWLGKWGYIENREQYLSLLAQSDVVISTALHDFQGLSILEAVALGCQPLLPNRLAYPEFIRQERLYACAEDIDQEAQYMVGSFRQLLEKWPLHDPCDVSAFSCNQLADRYRALFQRLSREHSVG